MRTPDEVKAFEQLYRSYSDDVFRFLLYLSGNWPLAQDLASESFVRAWTATVPIKISTAKAYLFTIARNLYLSHLRQRRTEIDLPAGLAATGNQATSYERYSELAETLEDLKGIAEGDRAAFVMAVIEETSYDEVSRSLGISVGAVKGRVFRARMRLTELREQRTLRSTL